MKFKIINRNRHTYWNIGSTVKQVSEWDERGYSNFTSAKVADDKDIQAHWTEVEAINPTPNQKLQAEVNELRAWKASMRTGTGLIYSYLSSSKFHNDTTVQTGDVLMRLSEATLAAEEAGRNEWMKSGH